MIVSQLAVSMSRRVIPQGHHIYIKSAALLSPSLHRPPRVYHPAPPHHDFHTSQCIKSPLFNLAGLSASRESQYLSKERGIPRTEFHPHLELIRSSEVDTQQAPGSRKGSSSTTNTPPRTTDDNVALLSQEDSSSAGNTLPRTTDDNTAPLSQEDSSSTANTPPQTIHESTPPLPPESVVIGQADYAALTARVSILQRKLGSSIAARRRLATILKERDESFAVWYHGGAIFLFFAIVFWVAAGRSDVREVEREESPQEDTAKVIHEASRGVWQNKSPGQPPAWSTWFWASGEDEH